MPTSHEGKSPTTPGTIHTPGHGESDVQATGVRSGMLEQVKLAPQQLVPRDVLYLQRAIGNRAVAQLLGKAQPAAARQPIEQPREHFAEEWQAQGLDAPARGHDETTQPSATPGATTGMIQRKIEQTFTQTNQTANLDNLKKFYEEKVLPDLKTAMTAVKEEHLALHAPALKACRVEFETCIKNTKGNSTQETWNLAAKALDELVNVVNMINIERSRPGQDLYDDEGTHQWKPIPGKMSNEGILDHWGYAPDQILNPDHYVSFYHTTTASSMIENTPIKVMPGSKEFGTGFYTTAADTDEPAKEIGGDWFTRKGKNPKWDIIRFSIPKQHMDFLQSPQDAHNQFLNYIFTHSSGYPNGGNAPNAMDLQLINAINLEGRVLIFPDNKNTKVSTTLGEKSWHEYTEHKLGGGGYELVIGPQQPENMGNWRQYNFTGQRAIWLVNTAQRFIAYKNEKK